MKGWLYLKPSMAFLPKLAPTIRSSCWHSILWKLSQASTLHSSLQNLTYKEIINFIYILVIYKKCRVFLSKNYFLRPLYFFISVTQRVIRVLSLNGEKIKEFSVNNIFQVIVRLFLSYEFFKSYLRGSDNSGKQSRYYFS